MEIVRDVKSFVAKNGAQLQKFFIFKTGITDRELIHDHIQEFYIKMIQTKALESYREEEGSFDTYICTLLCWLLAYKGKKSISMKYKFISQVQDYDQLKYTAEDVWDHLGVFEGPYKVDFAPCTPRILEDREEDLFKQYLHEFKDYINKTEHSHSKDQIITFLECKESGCNSSEVAAVLGVSDNMVKFIKQKLQKKFERWKTLN